MPLFPLYVPLFYLPPFPPYHILAMLYELDKTVEVVVRALDHREMLRDTLIVFASDNGGPANGYNNNHASNYPLRLAARGRGES